MIIGEKIRLRPLEKKDLQLKVNWVNDPDVHATLHYEIPLGLAKTEKWFDRTLTNDSRRDFVIETLNGQPAGLMGLLGINWIHRTAECYGMVGEKNLWGKGIGTEAHSLLIRWAFETLDLYKIWATVDANNPAMLKITEKLGFKVEGKLREEKYIGGKRVDLYRISVLRNEFKPTV